MSSLRVASPPSLPTCWGTERRFLSVGGGLHLGFEGLSRAQAESLEGGELEPAQPAVRVRVCVRRPGGGVAVPSVALDDEIPLRWEQRAEGLEVAGRYFTARLTAAGLQESAAIDLWTASESRREFNDAVTNFTRVVIALGCVPSRLLLLHSSAVARAPGRVALFFGRSGAGKSTLGALALRAGRRVLSDDLNSVDLGDPGCVTVQGFPWTGDHGPRSWGDIRTGELGAIFKLEQADRHEVVPLGRGRAVAGLASCAPFVNAEPSLYDRLLPVLEELATRVPVYTLKFKKDEGLWALVDEVLEARP